MLCVLWHELLLIMLQILHDGANVQSSVSDADGARFHHPIAGDRSVRVWTSHWCAVGCLGWLPEV